MSSDIFRIQVALAGRQSHADRLRGFQGVFIELVGQFDIIGVGETLVGVPFPVRFVEHPCITFGGELSENSEITAGNFPTISVMVHHWDTEEVEPGAGPDEQLFVGAALIAVVTGMANQRARAHFSVKGRALVNPLTEADSGS